MSSQRIIFKYRLVVQTQYTPIGQEEPLNCPPCAIPLVTLQEVQLRFLLRLQLKSVTKSVGVVTIPKDVASNTDPSIREMVFSGKLRGFFRGPPLRTKKKEISRRNLLLKYLRPAVVWLISSHEDLFHRVAINPRFYFLRT